MFSPYRPKTATGMSFFLLITLGAAGTLDFLFAIGFENVVVLLANLLWDGAS